MSPSDPPAARILVVDDEIQMAEMLADGLSDWGFAAVASSSGTDAVDRLRAERFDALVTDLRMPEMDGIELMSAVHRLFPELPVILMTAYGAVDSVLEAILPEASDRLAKPFKVEALVLSLDRALARREAGPREDVTCVVVR
jgi:DNA-binding NtrC family response regulator